MGRWSCRASSSPAERDCGWRRELLFPGMVRRKDALALAGGESIRLLAGTIPMLTIAGILEAFLSPSGAPVALKFSVCALLLVGLSFWLSEGGRTTPIHTESSEAVKAMA